jgi:hypothetical protein
MPELPELELDENHIYRLDGVQIPGCTAILAAMGATPGFLWLSPSDLEFYRSRGHAIHRAIELAIKGELDKRTISDEINPYLIGWDRFCEDHEVEVSDFDFSDEVFVEKPLYHTVYRYGVTPDVVAFVDKKFSVIELKATSAHAPATGLQLAAQALAVRQTHKHAEIQRIGLRLLPKEPYYDLKIYTERSDEAVFLSMLNTFNFLSKHKLLKEAA